ncbi:DUF1573 domain-containing protein [Gimesia fumaroli]|uniref:DUF1573 domain-containing protein n=1 Tax=Gimesia fumaroli TaxID=2527976 RepID=A0A518I634_9PLAN|nr:DUF1573 domain-containing protein [Gimesia fumaroli]QDV48520.1 hypothetical protein Enr17x_05320 [Gimesia fumaroli]
MKLNSYLKSVFYLLTGIIFLGSAFILAAKLDGTKTSSQPEGLQVTPLVLDLGKINQGEIINEEVNINNYSKDTFTNVKLLSSCGCTVVSNVPNRFLPGESFQPRIEFNSSGKRGKSRANLLLEYVSPGNQKETKLIELVADVEPTIYLTPTKLSFSPNDSFNSEQIIQLNSHNGVGFMIDLLSIDHFAFDCEEVFESAKDVESNTRARSIRIIFDSDRWKSNVKRMGKITDFKLRIKTNIKSEPAIEVPIEVQDTI